MAVTNQERAGTALDFLKDGLAPWVVRELKALHGDRWFGIVQQSVHETQKKQFKDGATPMASLRESSPIGYIPSLNGRRAHRGKFAQRAGSTVTGDHTPSSRVDKATAAQATLLRAGMSE